MNLFLWLMTGALMAIGFSFLSPMLCLQRLIINVVFGDIGALVGGAIAVPSQDWSSFTTDWLGLAAAALGALAMLAIANVHLIRRRRS